MRWLRDNLSSLLLAFVMSLLVWVSAVSAADPTQEQDFPTPVPIEYRGLAADLIVIGSPPAEAQVTLRAPRSVWDQLSGDEIHLVADLTGLQAGVHQVDLTTQVDRRPARVVRLEPSTLTLTLEALATRTVPVRVRGLGTPAVGYRAEAPVVAPTEAKVVGPLSSVGRVAQVLAEVNLTGLRADLVETVQLLPVDPAGQTVEGVRVQPVSAQVQVRVEQLGGYRDVAVKVVIEGQVAAGYWVTSITVSPPVVTVYSSDPEAVSTLPGFVETVPLVLTGASSNLELRLSLNLPEGISPVGEQTVLVQVGIAAIETSLTITRALEVQGLGPGLFAQASPDAVSVILTGPLPVLEGLAPDDVRVVVDLLGLGVGTHQVTPEVIVIPTDVVARAVLPSTIEVVISATPRTPTPTR
ncbi:MAG: CdaR family protein [Chloroflexota bacterium]